MMRKMDMFDSRKYCPQCGSNQVKYQMPKIIHGPLRLLLIVGLMISPALLLLWVFKPFPAVKVEQLAFVLPLLFILLAVIFAPVLLLSASRIKAYRFKCQQCGYDWTITKEEWLQASDAPAQTKTLSPQEREEKKAAVESLINQIKKM
jgi:predicted RNA-binding Zn-ribbon protein involved in translation (DUF1610 family)